MKSLRCLGIVLVLSTLVVPVLFVELSAEFSVQEASVPQWFTVEGLVEKRLNLTYAELEEFPQVSEVTTLQCVGGGQGGPKVTYNWTGVPLFYILSKAEVISGPYRKVVFNATDGFSSSVTLQTAMEPTTLLGLKANGTDLEHVSGLANGHKVVLPCRWGYKWVKWIRKITVVDYDYKGTYESLGNSDEALRPNCTMPVTSPPIRDFTASNLENYTVRVLSDSSIESFSFEQDKRLIFNVERKPGANGYFYVNLPEQLIGNPYIVFVDQNPTEFAQIESGGNTYIFFNYSDISQTIAIEGTPKASDNGGGGIMQRSVLV
jgi:hypothetical protein